MNLRNFVTRAVIMRSLLGVLALPAYTEPYPGIHVALRQINQALFILKHRAASDFHGHKAAAIDLLERARRQLQIGAREDYY